MNRFPVVDIFGPTIQGEGPVIGRPSVFVRFGGCDFRCKWCDSLHAVDPAFKGAWRSLSGTDILDEMDRLSKGRPLLVTLTGGNPALHDLGDLIRQGKKRGYMFLVETQGSKVQEWFKDLELLVLSPKGPSAGVNQDEAVLRECLELYPRKLPKALKVSIFSDEDYAYAKSLAGRYPHIPFYLQVGNLSPNGPLDEEFLKQRFRLLAERLEKDGWFTVTLLPQLHVWAWGNERCR
ncbi:MAG: 7-carboxy-7-deazaguanine synthase QueE [Alphaproteobacteria bacterium RIFOXYD12_FULL_60_8]|nr:MAG: 7-carboxy-7-deazaguanine synthase QueE [Alphaproteobacteria bacterium RIFOXYD12_FULL_60_8]